MRESVRASVKAMHNIDCLTWSDNRLGPNPPACVRKPLRGGAPSQHPLDLVPVYGVSTTARKSVQDIHMVLTILEFPVGDHESVAMTPRLDLGFPQGDRGIGLRDRGRDCLQRLKTGRVRFEIFEDLFQEIADGSARIADGPQLAAHIGSVERGHSADRRRRQDLCDSAK